MWTEVAAPKGAMRHKKHTDLVPPSLLTFSIGPEHSGVFKRSKNRMLGVCGSFFCLD